MRLYLDTAPVIYVVQQVAPFFATVDTRLQVPDVVLISSELTRLECLILPVRNKDAALVQDFETFFAMQVTEMVPFGRSVFEHATKIRANLGFKTPDALQLAAAVAGACDTFLTNDAQLKKFTGITVEVI